MDNQFSNIEAEQAVLGCALMMPEKIPALLLSAIKKEHFYLPRHKQIYLAIKTLFDKEKDCSIPLVSDQGIDPGELIICAEKACLEHQLESHCENIKNHARRRQLMLYTQDFLKKIKEEKDSKKLITDMSETLYSLMEEKDGQEYVMNEEVIKNVVNIVENRHKQKDLRGIPSGFPDLDNIVGGWQPGHLIFLLAVPKMGKSSMALEFALNTAEQDKSVLYFSLEMSKEEMGERQFANRQKIDTQKLLTGDLGSDWCSFVQGYDKLHWLKIGWVERPRITTTEIKAVCRRFEREQGLDLVIIDQLNKIDLQMKPKENKTDAIERVSNDLKVMAQNMKIPVICLHQLLDKTISTRHIPRPQLGDERDSSAPAQEADVLMYLWRPEFYWRDKYKNQAELIIARQRSGVSNTSIWLTWIPKHVALRSMPKDEWPKEVKPN